MRFTAKVPCQRCGTTITVETTGTDRFPDAKCTACKATIYLSDNSTPGLRMLFRSDAESQGGDFTLSVMLTAMAVEAELSFLFFKWKRIDLNMAHVNTGIQVTQAHEDAWEDEYRRQYRIVSKFDAVFQMLTGSAFDAFVASDAQCSQLMSKRHSAAAGVSPAKVVEENLFWVRNKIMHSGAVDTTKDVAEGCYAMASTLFSILATADPVKYNRTFPPQNP
jgi:hypothetical protein